MKFRVYVLIGCTSLVFTRAFSMSKAAVVAADRSFTIHVQGDSNTQGMLPGPICEWNNDIGAALNVPRPWPSIMQEALRKKGLQVTVFNHAESGRRLSGRTLIEGEVNGVGQKDGRVALQQIILLMMNQRDEQDQTNMLVINLGSNDLQPAGVTEADLYHKLLTHVVAILTNPYLQFNLLKQVRGDKASTVDFMKRLSRLIAAEITSNSSDQSLIDLVIENGALIQGLFRLIKWKIVIVPPVIMTGRPFGGCFSSELSLKWPEIVDRVVTFINSPDLFAVSGAQEFGRPHTDEFGGMCHLDADDHRKYGEAMAEHLAPVLLK